jgi:hypothetical protein
MGQAKQRKDALNKIVINNSEEFLGAIDNLIYQRVNQKYKLDLYDAELLLDDIGATGKDKQQVRLVIANLFSARLLVEHGSMMAMMDKMNGNTTPDGPITLQSVADHMYNFTKEMVEEGTYANWGEAVDESARMAMTYRCYEPWEQIVNTLTSWLSDSVDQTLFNDHVGKIISYLYDGYAIEVE